MFDNTQTITIDSVASSLTKTGFSPNTGEWTEPNGELAFSTRQTKTANRFRREVRISMNAVAADPISAVNKSVGASVYLVIDEPKFGFSDEYLRDVVWALKDWLTTPHIEAVLAGEF
jgi:predicted transglutaminase-like cysteine proteinase